MEDPLFGKPARNFAPATIWTGDNLDILRGINSETVDLIYLDPPFNSNRTYSAPIGSKAAGAAFEDTWTLDKEDVAWMGLIADQHPALHSVITAAGDAHSTGMQFFIPPHDGGAAAGDAPRAHARREHLPALRPDGKSLPEGAV